MSELYNPREKKDIGISTLKSAQSRGIILIPGVVIIYPRCLFSEGGERYARKFYDVRERKSD